VAIIIYLFGTLTIVQPSIIYAAPTASPVGVVNYQMLIQQHPDAAKAKETIQIATKQAQSDFEAKSASMTDNDKKAYYQQLLQGLQQQQLELLKGITDKIDAAVKIVADAKGLTIVVGSNAVVYGGQDITDDALKQIKGK
jgi:outer membrane protein